MDDGGIVIYLFGNRLVNLDSWNDTLVLLGQILLSRCLLHKAFVTSVRSSNLVLAVTLKL